MGQTLTNGIYLPDEGERNSYPGLEANWRTLDALILTVDGKAAPNVANTWTAAQTFTAGIVGDLTGDVTGTASRAIADEDGNSIKTSYGKLAGNNTWTGTNNFDNQLVLRNADISTGTAPSTSQTINQYFKVANDAEIGYSRIVAYDSGRTVYEFSVKNKFTNSALDPNGTYISSVFNFGVAADGKQFIETNAGVSSSLNPLTSNTYSLGTSNNQWSSVYAQSYYYNGTAWGLDKANTWTDNNIFNKNINPASVTSLADTTLAFNGLFNTIFLNTRGSSNRRSYGSFLFAGYGSASGADNYGQIQLLRSTDKRGDTNEGYIPDTSFKLLRVNPHSLLIDFMENVRVVNGGTDNYLAPITTNVTDLGTSTNKWKTINGINPGALSLPKGYTEEGADKDYIDITSVIQTLDGTIYDYTMPDNGWICIRAEQAKQVHVTLHSWNFGQSISHPTGSTLIVSVPFKKNAQISMKVDAVTLQYARFYPMQGNV